MKADTYALYLAYRDPRVPWYARLVAAGIVAYALSPIDLFPDPIPVLGYLDDLVIVPLGIILALKLIPPDVMAESRERARTVVATGLPVNRAVAVTIVIMWVAVAALAIVFAWRLVR